MCIDRHLEGMPAPIRKAVSFVASITLEIYLVQYVLIAMVQKASIVFPVNWLLLTALIVIAAFVLHLVVSRCIHLAEQIHEHRIKN